MDTQSMYKQVDKRTFPGLAVMQNRSLVQNTGMQKQNVESPQTRHSSVHLPKEHDKPFGFYPVNQHRWQCVWGRGEGEGRQYLPKLHYAARNGNGRVKIKLKKAFLFCPRPPSPARAGHIHLKGTPHTGFFAIHKCQQEVRQFPLREDDPMASQHVKTHWRHSFPGPLQGARACQALCMLTKPQQLSKFHSAWLIIT